MAALSRFATTNTEEIESLKNASVNENINKSTYNWVKLFKKWAEARQLDQKLENYEVGTLHETLEMFYAELRKKEKQDYELGSLSY